VYVTVGVEFSQIRGHTGPCRSKGVTQEGRSQPEDLLVKVKTYFQVQKPFRDSRDIVLTRGTKAVPQDGLMVGTAYHLSLTQGYILTTGEEE
jgi:hypothetical protein